MNNKDKESDEHPSQSERLDGPSGGPHQPPSFLLWPSVAPPDMMASRSICSLFLITHFLLSCLFFVVREQEGKTALVLVTSANTVCFAAASPGYTTNTNPAK